jgi:hypothetical protein
MLAAGVGAALVTVAVVAGRRPRPRRAGSPPPTRLPAPTRLPNPTPSPTAVADESALATLTPDSPPAPAPAPAEPELPLGFLSELHERFRADIDADAVPPFDGPPAGEPASNGAPPASGDRPPLPRRTGPVPVVPDPAPDVPGAVPPPAPPASPPPPPPAAPAEAPTVRSGGVGREEQGQRMWRVVGAVVLTAVFVVAVAAVAIGRSGDESDGTDAGGSAQSGEGASPTASVPPPTPQEAFTRASDRLRAAGSFAYSGGAHATDVSRVRPGLWLAVDVVIAGQVDLLSGRVHETAVAQNGGATETITADAGAWGRSAASPAELAIEPYRPISELTSSTPGPMGAALVPTWLSFASGAQDAGPDEAGRPTYRATLPAAVIGTIGSGQEASDAQIVLTLDPAGEPVRIKVTSLPDPGDLDLTLEVSDIGAPVTITPPP